MGNGSRRIIAKGNVIITEHAKKLRMNPIGFNYTPAQ
jgi:hypothetical protein